MPPSEDNLSVEETEALTRAKLGDLRKKLNSESWSVNMETLLADWGEKAAGLRFMHAHSGGSWRTFGNHLAVTSIIVTSIASSMSLVATSVEDPQTKNGILFSVGGIGLLSALIQSFKKFYNAEEKAAEHTSVSKQFGSFYRYILLQLSMAREDRDPCDVLTTYALKEYERLQQEAPSLGSKSIDAFKAKFSDTEQSVPDVAEDRFVINVATPPTTITKENEKKNLIDASNILLETFNNNRN